MLIPFVTVVGFVILLLIGIVFMQVGGIAITAVSFVDRTTEYDAPVWFSTVKWATLPVRLLDSGLSIYEFSEEHLERK